MKSHVITVTTLVGKKLLSKARLETTTEAIEVSGVVMGDGKAGEELSCLALLYAAHLYAIDDTIAEAISMVVRTIDPGATMVRNEKRAINQPSLIDVPDDLPF
jgi:hypothetical protein